MLDLSRTLARATREINRQLALQASASGTRKIEAKAEATATTTRHF